MKLPGNKTKIVATIGPATSAPEMLERLIGAGINVARLNFSHGDFATHRTVVERVREISQRLGRRVAIMADLPGPKMRIGRIEPGPVQLFPGDSFVLTSEDVVGDAARVSTSFDPLPRVVKPGDRLFLNDGLVQLVVQRVAGANVCCEVAVGGELSSRKGLNLPGIDLGMSAFTEHDRDCLAFALECGVDAISQSFVESAADLRDVREAAGRPIFLIAKIERYGALSHIDEILAEADGIMVARGDLGVETPIADIAHLQKRLIKSANEAAKPVITATQMLESMTHSRLPTRAEATDVANAIIDGTDCIMLSGESAVGNFPVESVKMLATIAASTERYLEESRALETDVCCRNATPLNQMTQLAEFTLSNADYDALIIATITGGTARRVCSRRPPVWVIAAGMEATALQALAFSRGVHPVNVLAYPRDWGEFAKNLLPELGLPCNQIMLVAGPSQDQRQSHHRLELFVFDGRPQNPMP